MGVAYAVNCVPYASNNCVPAVHVKKRKGVPSLQTLPPRADTESDRRSGTEWGWLARLMWGRFSNLDAVFTEIRIFPCYQC